MADLDNDGIDDALQGVTHVAMTAAARMGEQLARLREEQARAAQARSEQAAQELAARYNAEREAARASLASVHRPEWWDSAQSEDVTKAYETAKAWSEVDPEAVRAEQRIVEEVRNRYGVDVEHDGSPASVAEALDRAEHARHAATEQRGAAGAETAEAVGLMIGADAADRRAEQEAARQREAEDRGDSEEAGTHAGHRELEEHSAEAQRDQAGTVYDSAERRERLAEGLDHIENRAAIDARVRSDVAQGRPATEAVAHAPGKAPTARRARGQQPQAARRVQRPSRGR